MAQSYTKVSHSVRNGFGKLRDKLKYLKGWNLIQPFFHALSKDL